MQLRSILQGFLVGVVMQMAIPAEVSAEVAEPAAQSQIESGSDAASTVRATVWYSSDQQVTLSFKAAKVDAVGPNSNLELGTELGRYSKSVQGRIARANAFGTNLTQEFTAHAYAVEGRPTLGQDFKFSGYDIATFLGNDADDGVSLRAGLGYQGLSIDPNSVMPLAVSEDVAKNGDHQQGAYLLMQTALDRSASATDRGGGYRLSALAEIGAFASVRYSKITLTADVSQQVGTRTDLIARAKIGRGFSISGDGLPLTKNFTAGGVSDLRGFAAGGIGPVSPFSTGTAVAHIGGDTAFTGSLEVEQRLGAGDDLALIGFIDAGTVKDGGSLLDDLRSAAGIGLRWNSPIGPFDISYAKPIRSQPDDLLEPVQVSFGFRF